MKHAEDYGFSFRDTPLSAAFFSDSHLFHRDNGGAAKHLQKIVGTGASRFYFVGDTLDFEYIESALRQKGGNQNYIPPNFEDVLKEIGTPETETHLRIFDAMMDKASNGADVILMGGNHDPGLDLLDGETLGNIRIQKEDIFTSGNERLLIAHGQHFDPWFDKNYSDWVSRNACRIVDSALAADIALQKKYPSYLSGQFFLTNTIKDVAKSAGVLKPFRKNAAAHVEKEKLNGVICGHIHRQEHRMIETSSGSSIRYVNIGDALTHGTALVHTPDERASKTGGFVKLRVKDLPESSAVVLNSQNPLIKYRPLTMEFLQTLWTAQIEYLERKKPSVQIPFLPQAA